MGSENLITVGSTGMRIAYERLGDRHHPPVLLVMGIGAQMITWPDGFCAALVARGLQPIRFDNRDVGRSTHLVDAPAPDLPAALKGDLSSASYTLSDMAADAVGLLDALGIISAHVVGASLGGAIGQTMAIEHPARVRSLTTMMSTTGDPKVGQARPATLQALFGGPPATTRAEIVERAVRAAHAAAGPRYAVDEAAVRERAGREYDRGHDPVGVARQAVASVDRTAKLRTLALPTLVIHGADDPLCDPSGGRATAAAIPGAELVVIDGMGHNLPREPWAGISARIAGLVERAEAAL